jgi:hypothetical protein
MASLIADMAGLRTQFRKTAHSNSSCKAECKEPQKYKNRQEFRVNCVQLNVYSKISSVITGLLNPLALLPSAKDYLTSMPLID